MNKKIGLIFVFVIGGIAIVAIAYYLFSFSSKNTDVIDQVPSMPISDEVKINKQVGEVTQVINPPTNSIKKADIPVGQNDLERMAKSFAERFGSFSNQSNFANVTDLKMFMSTDMKKWADTYIEKNKKDSSANAVYYGLTTKALSVDTKMFDNQTGKAEVMVQTRRRESVGTTNNSSSLYNQDILITFVKEKSAWKVDSAFWQQK